MSRTTFFAAAVGLTAAAASPACDEGVRDPEHSQHVSSDASSAFPSRADAPFRLRDGRSNVAVDVRLVDAKETKPAPWAKDEVVYRAAANGRDLLVRSLPQGGFEDRIVLARGDEGEARASYELTLGTDVAGLRLVDGVVELLDAAGTPRLRMGAPVAHDHTGHVARLDVAIEGCAFDVDPRAPWGRPVVRPGSHICIVHVSWGRANLSPPAIIDPAWTPTGSLATPRYRHVAARLPNGDVLVSGGIAPDPVKTERETATTEIWSPATGAWAQGAPMLTSRAIATATPLANGDILVVGGLTNLGSTVLGSAEIYMPATGTWVATGSLATPRSGHTTTPVGDGTYLVAAGYDNSGLHFTNAELYVGGTFVPAGDINTTRFFHAAVTLPGNRVLVGGGTDPDTGALGTLELYTAGAGWAPAAALTPMNTARTLVTAAVLPDGDAIFFGGYKTGPGDLATAERYRASTNTWTTVAGLLNRPRYDAVAVGLLNGNVFLVGGQTLNRNYRDGELFDVATSTFTRFLGQSHERAYGHTATLLADGRVLAVGGNDFRTPILASSDLFDLSLPTVDAGSDDDPDASADAATDAHPSQDASVDPDGATIDAGATTDANAKADASHIDISEVAAPSKLPVGSLGGGGCAVADRNVPCADERFALLAFVTLLASRQRRQRASATCRR